MPPTPPELLPPVSVEPPVSEELPPVEELPSARTVLLLSNETIDKSRSIALKRFPG